MDQVRQQNPPGRFLQKDDTVTSGPVWWIEVSEERALAKTSQALREGAPQIRSAHKEELAQRVAAAKRSGGKRKRKQTGGNTPSTSNKSSSASPSIRRVPSSIMVSPKPLKRLPTDEYNQAIEHLVANVREAKSLAAQQEDGETRQQQQQQQPQQQQIRPLIPPPLTSNQVFQEKYYSPINKRARIDAPINVQEEAQRNDNNVPYVDSFGETPPLMAAPTPPIYDDLPPLRLDSPNKKQRGPYQYGKNGSTSSNSGLQRVHSLALSDFSMSDTNGFEEDGSFVNPFEDESDIANKVLLGRNHQNRAGRTGNHGEHSPLRNLSSNGEDNAAATATPASQHLQQQQQQIQQQPAATWDDNHMNPRYVIDVDGDYLEDEWLPSSNSTLVPFY
jgi:hypothetical protein